MKNKKNLLKSDQKVNLYLLRLTYFTFSVKIVPGVTMTSNHTSRNSINAIFEFAMRATFWKVNLEIYTNLNNDLTNLNCLDKSDIY